MSNVSRIFLVIVCLLAFTISTLSIGCAGKAAMTTITSLEARSEADTRATKNGVTVQVAPINPTNASQYPVLACEYQYLKKTLLMGYVTDKAKTDNVLRGVTFALKVTNNTDHIIKMAGSAIGLTVGGKDVNQMSVEQVLQVWAADYPTGMPPEIVPAVQGIPLWDESAKILPGRSSEVFATFQIDLHEGIGGATMAIYDLVTNTDAAGNPTERTNFDFNFKELTTTVAK
ncbi:MAG: hypothetical protein ABIK83_13390 [Candidatus Zixiibacteriota bacterium]